MDSVGQSRMSQLHGGRRDKLEVSPNLWAGVGLVRGGAGTALVGDPETVAERIDEYRLARIGIDTFILSGYPHLEEAYRFGELVLPKPAAGAPGETRGQRHQYGPFGESIAGDRAPPRASPASRDTASSRAPAVVAIIGGGFSGAALATIWRAAGQRGRAHRRRGTARTARRRPCLFQRGAQPPDQRAGRRMSLDTAEPDQFARWLEARALLENGRAARRAMSMPSAACSAVCP